MYDVWKNALAEIEQQISAANFSTWFQDTTLITAKDGYVRIGVKNSFYVKQLRNRYLDIITTALINNNIPVSDIEFEVQTKIKSKVRPREITKTPESVKEHIKTIHKTTTLAPENGLNQKYTCLCRQKHHQ